ncbi:MAG: hypothetical protein V7754_07355 [Halioglobus sp.]
MFFTNKHVVIALIVAPILAILAWFAVGHLAGEKAQPAAQGKSYPLVEKSNCRYDSGQCNLQNEDFKLAIELRGVDLIVQSEHPLQGVMLAIVTSGQEPVPVEMTSADQTGLSWRLTLAGVPQESERIYLVASTVDNAYFGDAATLFIKR